METSDIHTQKETRDSANAELTMITLPWLSRTNHRTLWGNMFHNKQRYSCITSWGCEINSKHWGQLSQGTMLMHDNAHSHTAVIPKPLYSKSPGISTIQPWHCIVGYYLFGPFKMLHWGCPLVASHDLKEVVHVCLATWLHTKAWAMLDQCDEKQELKCKASATVNPVFCCVIVTKYCTLQIHYDLLSQYWQMLNETYSSSSSIGTATLVGYGLLNYRRVFSAGTFLQSAVASGTSNPQLGGPVI